MSQPSGAIVIADGIVGATKFEGTHALHVLAFYKDPNAKLAVKSGASFNAGMMSDTTEDMRCV